MEIVKVSDPSLLAPSDVSTVALDFKVLHPVVITRLGVFPSGAWPELHANVTVKLFQLDQEVTGIAALRLPQTFSLFLYPDDLRAGRPSPAGGGGHGPLQCHQHRDPGEWSVVQTSGAVHLAQGQFSCSVFLQALKPGWKTERAIE